MGKRELLIAAVFLILGFGVYRLTAPPGDGSGSGFSIGRMINEIRREIRGQQGRAETTFAATEAVAGTLSEIRVNFAVGAITIVGEDRQDIEAEMHVRSTGYDNEEAERLAKASHLVFDEAGALLIISARFPEAGRQTPALRLKIPSRLGVRLDEKQSTLEITNVASVLIGSARGRTVIQKIAGSVSITQRGSELVVSEVGSLKLTTTSGVEARVSNVQGEATFSLQGGELHAEALGGSLEVESRNTEMVFDSLSNLKGPVRMNASLGELVMNGLAADTRIDGRRTEIRIDHAGGAPLAVYNEGDETIELTVPPTGFTMDALAVEGGISVDEKLTALGLKREAIGENAGSESARPDVKVTGAIRGGGPPITLRATRGDIVLRSR